MAVPKAKQDESIEVLHVEKEEAIVHILGTSPLILNRMSEKARRELLLPRGRLNAAQKQSNLKHDPLAEFRASPYTFLGDDEPTLLGVMASAFKGAICTAALDMPGTKKAQIGRLVYVQGELLGVYGIPRLAMHIVRSADMNRTPDVRSRALLLEWACEIHISYVVPLIREQIVLNLLAAAGMTSGIGDWRPEKGKGDYGQFTMVGASDAGHKDWERIVAAGGREAQVKAMADPVCHDLETEDLLSWYTDEVKRRGFSESRNGAVEKVAVPA